MKRQIALLLSLVVATALFAAGAQESTVDEMKVTITAMVRDSHPPAEGMGTFTDNMWTEWINENAPVNVEFLAVHPRDTEEKLNILFAAGDAPDLISHPWQNAMNPWADKGLLLPIEDLIEDTVNIKRMFDRYPEYLPRAKGGDGQIYFIGLVRPIRPNWALTYRKDWLDTLDLEVPKTLDELYDVMYAFTFDDPDRNGVDDTYGYSLAYAHGWYVDYWFGATENDFYIEGDGLVHDFARRYEGTKFKKRLFDAGIVSPDWLADTSGKNAQAAFYGGKTGMQNGGPNMSDTLQKTFFDANPDGVIDFLPTPITQFGQYAGPMSMPVAARYAINADTEYPEQTMAYADWLASPEATIMLLFGQKDRHYFINERGGAVTVTEEADPVAFQELRILNNKYTWLEPYAYVDDPAFWDPELTLDLDNPYAVNRYNWNVKTRELYINPDVPYHAEIMSEPTLPTEIDLIQTSLATIEDMWDRAVVSGDSYTPEDALAEAQALWDNSGGKQLEEFYDNWYRENIDSLILTKDWY